MIFDFYELLYLILGIILLPGIIFGAIAQAKVQKNYSKYSKVFSAKEIPANVMARKILDASGLQEVKVVKVSGKLTDHYNSKEKVLALSDEIYDSSSLAALGIAAHELGHALQDQDHYKPMKLRHLFGTLSNIGSWMLLPLIIVAMIFAFTPAFSGDVFKFVAIGGCIIFGLSIIFSLITVPIEKNASKRTEQILVSTGLLDETEYQGVKKVLDAAALTYVAALIISILSLLRFLAWAFMLFGKKD